MTDETTQDNDQEQLKEEQPSEAELQRMKEAELARQQEEAARQPVPISITYMPTGSTWKLPDLAAGHLDNFIARFDNHKKGENFQFQNKNNEIIVLPPSVAKDCVIVIERN